MKERNTSIDTIKGISIIFVVITHYAWSDYERLKYLFPFWIDMAVPMFLIISGYVYGKSNIYNKIDTISKAYNVKIIFKRFCRYTIPFFIAFMIEVIFYAPLGYIDLRKRGLIGSFFGGGFGPGSYYYVILLQLIAIFPIIYFIVNKYRVNGVVFFAIMNALYEVGKTYLSLSMEWYGLIIFRYLLIIAFGCYLAVVDLVYNVRRLVLISLLGIAYIIIFRYTGIIPKYTSYWTGTSFMACMYIMPIMVYLINNQKIHNRVLECLGKASFHIYLVQMVFYHKAVIVVYKLINNRNLQLFFCCLICVGIGSIYYFVYERIRKYCEVKRKCKIVGNID